MKIGNFDTEDKVMVIAEIGNNHEGDFQLAKELVALAAEAGADAVKFQYIIPEKLISPNDKLRIEQLNGFKLKRNHYVTLAEEANRLGVEFLCTPFDLSVVDFIDELVPAFKIASGDNNFYPLIDKIANTGKPIIASLGLGGINRAKKLQKYLFDKWQALGHKNPGLAFLHCVCSYPTPMEDAGIIEIDELNDLEVTAGYSDHTLGIKACELAVARGARIIEKHFTKCKNQSSFRDHQLSADPDDLKNMIHAIRIVEKFLGHKTQGLRKCEEKNYNSARRIPTALKKIRAGEKLTSENIGWMRSSNGESITLKRLNTDLLGTKLRSPKNPGEIIESKDLF